MVLGTNLIGSYWIQRMEPPIIRFQFLPVRIPIVLISEGHRAADGSVTSTCAWPVEYAIIIDFAGQNSIYSSAIPMTHK